MKKTSNKNVLSIDMILTFNTLGGIYNEYQEFFEIKIPLTKTQCDSIRLLNEKFFPQIYNICLSINRSPEELIKISTASNWTNYEEITKGKSPLSFGHPCKWFFGQGRSDLDNWEKCLMKKYGFGKDADMSWIQNRIN